MIWLAWRGAGYTGVGLETAGTAGLGQSWVTVNGSEMEGKKTTHDEILCHIKQLPEEKLGNAPIHFIPMIFKFQHKPQMLYILMF